ncbi:MAG: hypothetical protein AAFN68_13315, partial [Pseudomonadota bacterium]
FFTYFFTYFSGYFSTCFFTYFSTYTDAGDRRPNVLYIDSAIASSDSGSACCCKSTLNSTFCSGNDAACRCAGEITRGSAVTAS